MKSVEKPKQMRVVHCYARPGQIRENAIVNSVSNHLWRSFVMKVELAFSNRAPVSHLLTTRVEQLARLTKVFWVSLMIACCTASFAQTKFYSATDINLSSYANGALIRSEPLDGAPDGAAAYRVLYKSQGLQGEPIAVSGVVIIPGGPPPANGRPIVAWAHPTTGIVPKCAPSLARVFFESIQGLNEMLQRGYVVAATDYPGLGTTGPHPYLVGISEGRAVLDSVRVARSMPGAGGGLVFAVWGHSQGGQAALYTGILAQSYAPELELVGVAAAAPATELGTLLADDMDTAGGKNITAMTLWSWSRVYGAPISNVVTPQAMPAVDRLANECIERFFDAIERRGPSRELNQSYLTVSNLSDVNPWSGLLASNSPGTLPPSIPVFLAQGMKDTLVQPAVTENYMQGLCKAGSAVQWYPVPGSGHLFVARDSAGAAIDWIAARFGGSPAPSNCGAH
jgi:acetyl esterase/lipase